MRGGEEDVRVAFVGPLLGCAGSVLDRGGQVQRGEAALEALRLPVGPELLSVLLGVFAALGRDGARRGKRGRQIDADEDSRWRKFPNIRRVAIEWRDRRLQLSARRVGQGHRHRFSGMYFSW